MGDGGSSFTDDDTGFLGRDESSESEGVFLAVVDGVRSFEGRILGSLGRDGFCLGWKYGECKVKKAQSVVYEEGFASAR